jgi:hypothetical protein
MASATLEMFIKLVGANKVARSFNTISNELKEFRDQTDKAEKKNKKFASSLSGLQKTAIAGSALIATKTLFDFSKGAVEAAVSADEAASAFGTTFGSAAERATRFLEDFANKAGLTVAEAQQLQATLGAVAQGIGFTQEASADLSIELTKIAADVASFSNISAGAEPVLNAFRSALVGEREALKTYGIAITEAEVQTEAFIQTGKENADMLTRQEKALATLALIQQKAAVQIGDLDRTQASFANQSRLVNAELRELREEIGRELIPALEVLLPKFRELIQNVTPSLIEGFASLGDAVIRFVLALDRLNDLDKGIIYLINNFSDLAEEQRFLNEISDRSIDQANLFRVQQAALGREVIKVRTQLANQTTQLDKYTTKLTKGTLPAIEKYLKFMALLNDDNDELIDLNDELAMAQDNLTEAQRREALSTAEEALQKKELQKEIAELLFFQKQGVDVSEELAVAQEKLKLVEFELTRESEELRDAKKELNDIETLLEVSVAKTTSKLEDQLDKYVGLNEQVGTFKELAVDKKFMEILAAAGMANPFLATGLSLMSELAAIQGLDNRARELERFADAAERLAAVPDVPIQAISAPVTATVPMFGQQELSAFQGAGFQGGQQKLEIVLQVEEEEIQRVNTTIQQRGKQFVIAE